ncbi:MAG TPA: T9SS type A sorting domain-containing protein, partial [Bacteroidota bacterium]
VDSRVSLKVYNLLGQEVRTLVDGDRKAGFHQETFDARTLASGVYVYQLNTGSFSALKRLVLLK